MSGDRWTVPGQWHTLPTLGCEPADLLTRLPRPRPRRPHGWLLLLAVLVAVVAAVLALVLTPLEAPHRECWEISACTLTPDPPV